MFHTRVCDLFGIEYPILQSPMNYPVTPALVAGVSNAGGLGICSNNMGADFDSFDSKVQTERMRSRIREVRELTDKPIGINVLVRSSFADAWVQLAVEERVPVVYTSLGSPSTALTERLHEARIKVISIGSTVRHAIKAMEAGADAFAVAGVEAGGHSPGHGETTLFTILPQVVDAVDIPVLAGCGVGDARGFIAALALGAEGVCMGTRFVATHESRWHPAVKRALLNAGDGATVAWGKALGTGLGRTLKNSFTEKYLEMEANGATAEELQTFIDGYTDPANRGLDRKAGGYFEVDLKWGEIYMGTVSGLIRELKHAGDVVTDMIAEASKVLTRLHTDPLPARL
jgi:enoyl-[acyl-carrier protein] reductase II